MSRPTFVIWAPPFSEDSGGAIVLHLLCHRLNLLGHTAVIWPWDRSLPRLSGPPRRWLGAVRYWLTGRGRRFSLGPFPNRLAKRSDLRDAVVLYPEIVAGNPLGAERVARWFLHRPGYHTGTIDYGAGELYFHMLEPFRDESARFASTPLYILWLNETYRRHGDTVREGSCYMLRKGAGRPLVHDAVNSTLLDGRPTDEIVQEFNRRERFYCYDPYTMYARFAAICGCLPIVVPTPGVSKEEWLPDVTDRYGLAYGDDDLAWAIATRDSLLETLKTKRAAEDAMVEDFVRRCRNGFAPA